MVIFMVITGVLYLFVYLDPARNAPPGQKDMRAPRAPAEASNWKNPIPNTPVTVSQGEKIYKGKGTCFACHGITGKGDGPSGKDLRPSPRDFTNPKFFELRTDGELFWVIVNGSLGTRMFSYSPSIITEEEAWTVVHYLRALGRGETG